MKVNYLDNASLPKLGFGMMCLPKEKDADENDVDNTVSRYVTMQITDRFMREGFHYYDASYAYNYGLSEQAIMQALVRRFPRDNYWITDTLPINDADTKADLLAVFDSSLARVGVDAFDLYLLHSLVSDDSYERAKKTEAFELLHELKEQGRIRYGGFSFNGSADVLDKILTEHPEVDVVQLTINYVDWDDPIVQSRLCYETARKHNKKIVAMNPDKNGTLASLPERIARPLKRADFNASLASWALRFAASHEGVIAVLYAICSSEDFKENMSPFKNFQPLTDAEKDLLAGVAKEIAASEQATA